MTPSEHGATQTMTASVPSSPRASQGEMEAESLYNLLQLPQAGPPVEEELPQGTRLRAGAWWRGWVCIARTKQAVPGHMRCFPRHQLSIQFCSASA